MRPLSGSWSTQFAQPAIVPPASDSSLASSTDVDSMHQVLPTDEQVEVGVVLRNNLLSMSKLRRMFQHDHPTLKSGESINHVETIAEKPQLEEEQSI